MAVGGVAPGRDAGLRGAAAGSEAVDSAAGSFGAGPRLPLAYPESGVNEQLATGKVAAPEAADEAPDYGPALAEAASSRLVSVLAP